MAHVIDSLLIEIGIDPTRFSKDYKNYLARLNEVKDQTKKQATGIEEHGKKIGETFSSVTNRLLGLVAVFVTARGVSEFVQQIVHTDTALGRLSARVGVGVSALSNWQNAGQLMGGTAEGMANVFDHLNTEIQNFKYTGESSLIPLLRTLSAAGGQVVEITQPVNDMLKNISANLAEIRKTDPRGANYLARLLGADEATAAAIVQGPEALQKFIDKAKALGEVTDKNTKSASQLWETWSSVAQIVTTIARDATTASSDFISGVGGTLTRNLINLRHLYKGESLEAFSDQLGQPFRAPKSPFSNLKWKEGQKGSIQPGTEMLAAMIQGAIPDLNQFTAGNDAFHKGLSSGHNKGLALDFTLTGGSAEKYRNTVEKLQALYGTEASFGYHPTGFSGSTADHIHAAFASEAAAARFGSQHNETVNISTVNINVGSGDPEKIKAALLAAGRQRLAAQANSGLQ